ncbi:MAG: hypothetical protein V5A13_10215 [Haloarculaceae archaeon]
MDDESGLSSDLQETLRDHRGGGQDANGTLVLSDNQGYVGDTVTLQGRNLQPDSEYEVVWHTTAGSWGVLEANRVVGPQYQPRTVTVITVRTDDGGSFDHEWTIPEDYGGSHRVTVEDDGATVARSEFEIRPYFEIDRTTAPLGESFRVTGYGLGPEPTTNNYQISWDTGNVGFMTGVMNRGTATAEIRAAGGVGEHVVQVWRNYRGVPYLQNNTQSPFGPVAGDRPSAWTVEVTEPEERPPTAWVDPLFDEQPLDIHYPPLDEDTAAELSVSPECGPPGTDAIITGREFPPNTEVDLVWYQHYGEGIRGPDVHPEPRPEVLPTVRTDADGSFQFDLEIPKAEGSTRPIVAEVDGRSVAVTGFMVQPSIERFEPTSGPVGTRIEIELSGIGWTAYENTQFFTYDNKPLGYACGMSDEHKSTSITVSFRASGDPGYHFIDVYPAIFETREDEPDVEIRPHLSYLDNHPMRPLPAMHMTFEVTDE